MLVVVIIAFYLVIPPGLLIATTHARSEKLSHTSLSCSALLVASSFVPSCTSAAEYFVPCPLSGAGREVWKRRGLVGTNRPSCLGEVWF